MKTRGVLDANAVCRSVIRGRPSHRRRKCGYCSEEPTWYRSVTLVSFLWWPNLPELCEKQHVIQDFQSAAEDEGPAKHRHAEQVSGKRWTDRGGQAARHRGDAGRCGPFLRCDDCHDIRASCRHIHLRKSASHEK